MSNRRELLVAIGLCLVGAALVLLAMSRPWLTYHLAAAAPLPSREVDIAGARLAPGARVLGLVGLAGVAALPASRRRGRTVVGLLLALAGAGLVADLIRVLSDPLAAVARADLTDATRRGSTSLGGWPYVAMLGGLLILAAGALVVVRGRRWEELSARYDAPTEQAPPGEASLWDALDRGEDPTG
jgi:uncharacterized membrane protein (TIGR02234 family)